MIAVPTAAAMFGFRMLMSESVPKCYVCNHRDHTDEPCRDPDDQSLTCGAPDVPTLSYRSSASNPGSSTTSIPSSSALANFEPGLSPATT